MRGEGSRYTFGALDAERESQDMVGTKVCPRCGQPVFADMRYCYECLYDFEAAPAHRPDQADPIELDEIDEPVEAPQDGASEEGGAPSAGQSAAGVAKAPASAPQDTVRLNTMAGGEAHPGEGKAPTGGQLALRVNAQAIDLTLPLGPQGIRIGREPDNDIVLHSRLVSRSHAYIEAHGDAVVLRNLGATNPPRIGGRRIDGQQELGVGDTVEICGTALTLVELPG